MKTCKYGVYNSAIDEVEPCGNLCEGNTDMCASHNAFFRKLQKQNEKSEQKRALQIQKSKEKGKVARKTISKNPKDWGNTFLCSDGTRVTQLQINVRRHEAYEIAYHIGVKCQGCGGIYLCFAHVIPQARCKQIGKTELIWALDNFFPSCFECNSAIENPKGQAWKSLRNIDKCIQFIYEHDKELYFKFEAQGWQAKIKQNEII